MADDSTPGAAGLSRLSAIASAWVLLLVQLVALGAVCAGVAMVYRPAALIVGGLAVIYAIERGAG